jgi:hypothetical protein
MPSWNIFIDVLGVMPSWNIFNGLLGVNAYDGTYLLVC